MATCRGLFSILTSRHLHIYVTPQVAKNQRFLHRCLQCKSSNVLTINVVNHSQNRKLHQNLCSVTALNAALSP